MTSSRSSSWGRSSRRAGALAASLALHAAFAAALLAAGVAIGRGAGGDEVLLPELMGRRGMATAETEGTAVAFAVALGRPSAAPATDARARPPLVDPEAAAPAEEAPEPPEAPPTFVVEVSPRARPAPAPTPSPARPRPVRRAAPAPAAPSAAESETAAAPAPGFAAVHPADLPPPVYPRSCLILHHEGVVLIDVRVGATGEVLSADVAERSCCSSLDEAALSAVRAARYVPGRRNGVAVEMRILQPIRFVVPPA